MSVMALKECLYNRLDAATALWEMKEEEYEGYGKVFTCLLIPPIDGSVFAYGRPALAFYVYMDHDNKLFACIHSIDDSGVSIFGGGGGLDKLVEYIKNQEYRCPTKVELAEFCQSIGAHPDYW